MPKVVIVTGAGGFIGQVVAMAFGKIGDKVVVSDLSMSNLPKLAEEINKGPGAAFPYQADVRDYQQIEWLVEETIKKWNRLDVMACVAGGGFTRLSGKPADKPLIEYTDQDWDLVVEPNLKGVFHSIKAAAKPMMTLKSGHIIIMGSGTGVKGGVRRAAYAAAKAGVFGLMKSAARELGQYNVKVNVVNPGGVLRPGEVVEDRPVQDYLLKGIYSDASHVAQVAAFFVHLSRMENISGQIFNLDSRIMF